MVGKVKHIVAVVAMAAAAAAAATEYRCDGVVGSMTMKWLWVPVQIGLVPLKLPPEHVSVDAFPLRVSSRLFSGA